MSVPAAFRPCRHAGGLGDGTPQLLQGRRAPHASRFVGRRRLIPAATHSDIGTRDVVYESFGNNQQTSTPPPTAEVVASARSPLMMKRPCMATVIAAPPQVLNPLLASNPPLLIGASAIATVTAVAAVRQLLKTSQAEAEELLLEVAQEMEHASKVIGPGEAQLQARAESALRLAEAAEAQAKLGLPTSRSVVLQLERSLSAVAAGLQESQAAVQERPRAAAAAVNVQGTAQAQDTGAGPARTLDEGSPTAARRHAAASIPESLAIVPTASSSSRSENRADDAVPAGSPDSSRVQQIMGRVQDILAVLEQHEQQHMLRLRQQHDAAPPQPASSASGMSPSEIVKLTRGVGADRSTPPSSWGSDRQAVDAGLSSGISATAASAQATAPAPSLPVPPSTPPAAHTPSSVQPSPWDVAPARQPPPEPSSRSKAPATGAVADSRDLSLTQLKHRLLDIVYGTARGVSADLNHRGCVEELVTTLEAHNPNCMVTDALDILHGRWKLVYTNSSPTLMLLRAIQSVPLVDIGDVYQVVDATTLTAHNKIDLALPVVLSLRADSGVELRSPRSLKLRFHRIGLDTYIQTPQFLAALDVPDTFSVLGQTIDLQPLRKYLVEPVQSGVNQAQELMRRAASPDVELPALESNCLWMMTTYLDDTLRISRDDAGATFVMLRDA